MTSLQKTEPGGSVSMLRSSGGGSHVIQANVPPFGVTLAGLFATPVSCGALAASPQSGTASEVLPTSSVRVRTRTGRIGPVEPPPTAPFFIRLSVHHQYDSRTAPRCTMEQYSRTSEAVVSFETETSYLRTTIPHAIVQPSCTP